MNSWGTRQIRTKKKVGSQAVGVLVVAGDAAVVQVRIALWRVRLRLIPTQSLTMNLWTMLMTVSDRVWPSRAELRSVSPLSIALQRIGAHGRTVRTASLLTPTAVREAVTMQVQETKGHRAVLNNAPGETARRALADPPVPPHTPSGARGTISIVLPEESPLGGIGKNEFGMRVPRKPRAQSATVRNG